MPGKNNTACMHTRHTGGVFFAGQEANQMFGNPKKHPYLGASIHDSFFAAKK
jgi:hypothetical protein